MPFHPFALMLWSPAAQSAVPLLYAHGDAPAVVAQIRPVLPTDTEVEPVSIVQLAREPIQVDGGTARSCTDEPMALAVLIAQVRSAEGDLLYLDYDKAAASLDQARASLVCLVGAADRNVLARIYFLDGYAHFALGDLDASRDAFRHLFEIEPTYAWDPALPPDATELFDTTRDELRLRLPVTFSVVPTPPGSLVLVDGRSPPPSGTLQPGTHLLQIVGRTTHNLEIDVDGSGPVTVIWPALVPSDGLSWMGDPQGQAALAALLDRTHPSPTGELFVQTPTDTWRRSTATESFQVVSPPEKEPRRTPWLVLGGSVLATGTATLAFVRAGQANAAADLATRTESLATYDDASQSYEAATRQRNIALALTAGGVALAGVGIVVPVAAGWSVTPSTSGPFLGLTVTRVR